ncbi:hypothetical protein EON82_11710 [bacterium]|nr:MAG: hypothetical protein EON82_11710 [bacterium]
MKHGHSLAIGILALALAACGGNSGGGSKSSGNGLTSTPRIEAVLLDPSLDPAYPYMDPLAIETGDNVQFQLVSYSASGGGFTRNVLSPESFRTTDINRVAGTFSSSDGVFNAVNTDIGSRKYIVTARYNNRDFSSYYTVNPRQIRLHGRVLNQADNTPVPGVTVDFYALRNPLDPDSQTVVIASTHTLSDGTFKVSIPAFNDSVETYDEAIAAPTISFQVRASDLPTGFTGVYTYEGATYQAGSSLDRPVLYSDNVVTSTDTGDSTLLPFKSGERYLITGEETFNNTSDDEPDPTINGTILLEPQ